MKIAVYTSSLNGKEALHRLLERLRSERVPVADIIVVDNRSDDGTCLEPFPEDVTLLCHLRNLGTSGAAATAFEYALDRGYDWLWVLDQDTLPEPDALEKLVELHDSFTPEEQGRLGVLSSQMVLHPSDLVVHGRRITPYGVMPTPVPDDAESYDCDAMIWSGSMFNLRAVRDVGLPHFGPNGCWEDLALDYGDLEYTCRIKRAGYRVLGHVRSRMTHPVGSTRHVTLFGHTVYSTNHSPFRRYLYFRNMVFFWWYVYPLSNRLTVVPFLLYRFLSNNLKVLLLERDRRRKLVASVVGVRDGFGRRLHRRLYYDA